MKTLRWLFMLGAVVVAGCHDAGKRTNHLTASNKVDKIMSGYAAGTFDSSTEPRTGFISGWVMTNERGQRLHRATLQQASRPVIEIGREAVPALVQWLSHDQMEIRYIASYSLERITVRVSILPHFATLEQLKTNGWLAEASSEWLGWYSNGLPSTTSSTSERKP